MIKLQLVSFKDYKTASGGGVFRNSNGDWLKGFTIKFRVRKPVEAELLAIRYGLDLAKKMNMTRVLLEIDAKAISMMLANVEAHMNHELGAILYEVSELLKELQIDVLYSPRTTNMVAHCLGRQGWCINEEVIEYDDVPDYALKHFEYDLKNISNGSATV